MWLSFWDRQSSIGAAGVSSTTAASASPPSSVFSPSSLPDSSFSSFSSPFPLIALGTGPLTFFCPGTLFNLQLPPFNSTSSSYVRASNCKSVTDSTEKSPVFLAKSLTALMLSGFGARRVSKGSHVVSRRDLAAASRISAMTAGVEYNFPTLLRILVVKSFLIRGPASMTRASIGTWSSVNIFWVVVVVLGIGGSTTWLKRKMRWGYFFR